MPKAERKEEILDIRFSDVELQTLAWAADLEALKTRTWARRTLLLAARERIRIEGSLNPSRPTKP